MAEATALAGQLPRHTYVMNLHGDRYRYLRAFCAAVIAGQCTLMPPNRQAHTLAQLAEIYPDSYVIGEDGDEPQIPYVSDADIPTVDPEQLCAIAFTSGSTGTPKPNDKYWRTLEEGAKGNARLLLGENVDALNMVATVPPQHMWGMETTIILPLFAPVAISDKTPRRFTWRRCLKRVPGQNGSTGYSRPPLPCPGSWRSTLNTLLQRAFRMFLAAASREF
jgi:acyl-coenzyme A synthetase/AMP-(fatty) acid ligase